MAFKLNRSSKEPMSEINVTPFVDVMLVLLIIFMVTAPLLTVGVQVDLPESSADSSRGGRATHIIYKFKRRNFYSRIQGRI